MCITFHFSQHEYGPCTLGQLLDSLLQLHNIDGRTAPVGLGQIVIIGPLLKTGFTPVQLLQRHADHDGQQHGRVEGPGPSLVQKNRTGLAMLLLLAVLAYGAWEWQQSPRGLIPANAWSQVPSADDDD